MKGGLRLGIDKDILATVAADIAATMAGVDAKPRVKAEIGSNKVEVKCTANQMSVSNPELCDRSLIDAVSSLGS